MKKMVKRWIRNGHVRINHHWYIPRDPWYGSSLQLGAWAWFGRYVYSDEKTVCLHSFVGYSYEDQPNVIDGVILWKFWEKESNGNNNR